MTTKTIPTLAEHLAEHERVKGIPGAWMCECRASGSVRAGVHPRVGHAAHVAESWTRARTVTTIAQLEALPSGSVVISADFDTVLEHVEEEYWLAPGCCEYVEDVDLPALVLHLPADGGVA